MSQSPEDPQTSVSASAMPLEDMLRIMDVATTIRRERERAAAELDVDETRALLRNKLLEAAATSGETITEAEVDVAIELYHARLHAFAEPARSWRTLLAHAYIRRGTIAMVCGATLALLALGWWLFFSAGGPLSATGREQRALASATATIAVERARIDTIGVLGASDRARLESLAREAEAARIAREPKRLAQLATEISAIRARAEIDSRQRSQSAATVRAELAALDAMDLDATMRERVDGLRRDSEAALASGDLPRLIECSTALVELRSGLQRASTALQNAKVSGERDRAALAALTLDAPARAAVDRSEAGLAAAMASGDPQQIDAAASALTELRERVAAAFEIRIANPTRNSGDSAVRRDFTDERGTRVSGYFVIVEARDASGRVVPQRVRDAESGVESRVQRWAEMVPAAVYERLKQDKIGDGVLDETLFAQKRAGELDPRMVLPDANGRPLPFARRLTRWE